METSTENIIKHREIEFVEFHPDPQQAHTAALLLVDVEGIMEAIPDSPTLLQVHYDLMKISLEQIDSALDESGFHLSSKLLYKLRRALYYYTEETERANNGCHLGDPNCTRKIFINRYQLRDHSCRDLRPDHWRKYL